MENLIVNVMNGRHSGVQTKIKEKYHYTVYCYAYQLNQIMASSTSEKRDIRILCFWNYNIFSHSTQWIQMLDKIVGVRLPSGSTTRWNCHSRSILIIFLIKNDLNSTKTKKIQVNRQTNHQLDYGNKAKNAAQF